MTYSFTSLIDVADTANGTSISQSRTYSAGDRALVWIRWAGAAAELRSVTDGTNTYTQVSTTLDDTAHTSSSYALYECKNCAAGTVTVTASWSPDNPSFRAMAIARYAGLDTTASGVGSRAAQQAPGTGTDALSSGNVTPASQPAALIGFGYDDSANAVTAGTGFTDRGTLSNMDSAFGTRSRVEDKRLTATTAVPATFTGSNGADNYITFGIVIPENATITLGGSALTPGTGTQVPNISVPL
jgi:hypothetical protein